MALHAGRRTGSGPGEDHELQYVQAGVYWPYVKERKTYNCPLDQTNSVTWQKRGQRISSYIMNGAVCAFGRFDRTSYKLGAFNPAAYVMWEPDIKNFGGTYGPNVGMDASSIRGRTKESAIGTRKAL